MTKKKSFMTLTLGQRLWLFELKSAHVPSPGLLVASIVHLTETVSLPFKKNKHIRTITMIFETKKHLD